MNCKGCGENKKLIKAHIIPKSFYMDLRGDANHLNVVPSDKDVRESRSNIGDYDQNILCKECDSIIESYDDYGKKVLLDDNPNLVPYYRNGELLGWELSEFNSTRLKLFFLSILWRASISSRHFFRRITLGEYEDVLKELIWSGGDDGNRTFGVILAKFLPANIAGVEKSILDPDNLQIEERNYYRLYLGGYNAWIRVDDSGPAQRFKNLEISENANLKIVPRSFQNSKEYQVLSKSIQDR